MRFTLFNLLVVNTLVALGLGIVLGDESRIRKNAAQRYSDMQYIAASEAWRKLPARGQRKQPLNRELLFYHVK